MPGLIREIVNKNLVKIFFGSAISTTIRIFTTVILSKTIAEKLGPQGLGLIGQFTSFVSIILLIGTGGFQNGILTFTSLSNKTGQLPEFIKPSFKLTLIISFICSILLFSLAQPLSYLLFNSKDYTYAFYILGITLLFISTNTYFNSFLNGISNFKLFNTLNIINSLSSLIVTIIFIYFLGIKGALISVVLSQALTFVATFYFMGRYNDFFKNFFKVKIDRITVQKLLPFIKMTFFSAILLPVSQIIIRNLVLFSKGNIQMGILEATNRISGVYSLIIINIMLIYYLPKISITNDKKSSIKEITGGALLFGSMFVILGVIIYILRKLIVKTFLSSAFDDASYLILPQLMADFFKILYYLFAYFAISKSLSTYYIITEIIFFCLYISLATFAIPAFGAKGAIYANAFTNFCTFLIHFFFIGKVYFQNRNPFTKFLFGKLSM